MTIGIIIGLIIGVFVGVFAMSLARMSADAVVRDQ